jgi:hypothetical protein
LPKNAHDLTLNISSILPRVSPFWDSKIWLWWFNFNFKPEQIFATAPAALKFEMWYENSQK